MQLTAETAQQDTVVRAEQSTREQVSAEWATRLRHEVDAAWKKATKLEQMSVTNDGKEFRDGK